MWADKLHSRPLTHSKAWTSFSLLGWCGVFWLLFSLLGNCLRQPVPCISSAFPSKVSSATSSSHGASSQRHIKMLAFLILLYSHFHRNSSWYNASGYSTMLHLFLCPWDTSHSWWTWACMVICLVMIIKDSLDLWLTTHGSKPSGGWCTISMFMHLLMQIISYIGSAKAIAHLWNFFSHHYCGSNIVSLNVFW